MSESGLLYLGTGDERFHKLTVGLQDLALGNGHGLSGPKAARPDAAKEYWRLFDCNIDPTQMHSSCY